MNTCLDEDTVLRLGAALGWEIEEPLRHLNTCTDCAAMLADLRDLHQAFDRSEPLDPELITQIVGALEEERRAETATAGRVTPSRMERGIRFFAAAVIALVVLTTAAAVQADEPISVVPALLIAVLSGVIASVSSVGGGGKVGATPSSL